MNTASIQSPLNARNIETFVFSLFRRPQALPGFTVATLPSPVDWYKSNQSAMIFVSNEAGGSVPAFTDGTNWRRVTDRNIVS